MILPMTCVLQGGPYYDVLHSLLGAYVCYQPEIGYVQGMSFIAAVLLLNMEEIDAFICFANLLNKPCHKAFFSLDVRKVIILCKLIHVSHPNVIHRYMLCYSTCYHLVLGWSISFHLKNEILKIHSKIISINILSFWKKF